MQKQQKLNTLHQVQIHRLNRNLNLKQKYQSGLLDPIRAQSKLQVQSLGEYIMRNIHSNRKNVMELYKVEVRRHKRKEKSFSLPVLARQAEQLNLIQKHLQTQEFKCDLLSNQQSKKNYEKQSDCKSVIVGNSVQVQSPSSLQKSKKIHLQPLKKKYHPTLQPLTRKILQEPKCQINPQGPALHRRKRQIKLQDKLRLRENSDVNPWQNLMKWRITSQNSNILL